MILREELIRMDLGDRLTTAESSGATRNDLAGHGDERDAAKAASPSAEQTLHPLAHGLIVKSPTCHSDAAATEKVPNVSVQLCIPQISSAGKALKGRL